MDVCMDGCMDGCGDGRRMVGWMDGWMDIWMGHLQPRWPPRRFFSCLVAEQHKRHFTPNYRWQGRDAKWQQMDLISLRINSMLILVVIPCFKTAGHNQFDTEWVEMLMEITDFTIRMVKNRNLCGWLWAGDFNFEPMDISGVQDKKARRQAWGNSMKKLRDLGGEPCCMNPKKREENLPHGGTPRHATQCDGMRGIDLAVTSASLRDRVEMHIHNATHCKESGACNTSNCENLCCSDHWGLEISIRGGRLDGDHPEILPPA